MAGEARFMERTLTLARRARPSPNPRVGAVLVKGGKVVGEGFHEYAGGPHAEIVALKKAGEKARGATLYLNLEPCSHYGRTPPCTQALIAAGVKRVVAAMKDPNPRVNGNGAKKLEAACISVEFGLMEKEARELNEKWIHYIIRKMPFVTLKAGMSFDGKIAAADGKSKWITSEEARTRARRMRSEYDAILVGAGTVLADDPRLTALGGGDPVRVILDSGLSVPLGAKVFADDNVIIATTAKGGKAKKAVLKRKGVRIWVFGGGSRVNLRALLKKLAENGITSVLVEGGSEVAGSFVSQRLVDKFMFFVAPKILGGKKAKGVVGGEGFSLARAPALEFKRVERVGPDLLVEAVPKAI